MVTKTTAELLLSVPSTTEVEYAVAHPSGDVELVVVVEGLVEVVLVDCEVVLVDREVVLVDWMVVFSEEDDPIEY